MKTPLFTIVAALFAASPAAGAEDAAVVCRSARSGPWSAAATWEEGRVPGANARVLVRGGHTVVYDVASDKAIRGIIVAGTLTFATDKTHLRPA